MHRLESALQHSLPVVEKISFETLQGGVFILRFMRLALCFFDFCVHHTVTVFMKAIDNAQHRGESACLARKVKPERTLACRLRRGLVQVVAHPLLLAAPQRQSFLGKKT